MIGFEIEIALPVVDEDGDSFAGDVTLAKSATMDIRLVTDHRADYSNLEFVTAAFSVIGRFNRSGPADLVRYLNGIKAIRNALYKAGSKTLPVAGGALLNTTDAGSTAKLDPGSGYVEDANQRGGGDGLYVQYSVGVPLKSLDAFFTFLRANVAPYSPDVDYYLDHARWRTFQAKRLADEAEVLFRDSYPLATAAARTELRGYIQLVYTQVAAMADYVGRDEDEGQIKNETVALCRSDFDDIFKLLQKNVQDFLKAGYAKKRPLVDLIAKYQEVTEIEDETMDFKENASREIGGQTTTLLQYAQSALTGAPGIAQQSIFGGMRMIPPHPEEGTTMIPFELRTMGSMFKTWAEVQADLATLTRWVQSVV